MTGGVNRVRIRPAGSDDIEVLARMLTRAAPQRPAETPQAIGGYDWSGYFRLFLAVALVKGMVHTTADRTAAALWLPRQDLYPPPPGCTIDPSAYIQAMRPHFHLTWFGVEPRHRRCGVGSALLAHQHRYLDAHGLPALLYAWDAHTRDWLTLHGYHPIPMTQAPQNQHSQWPMWREPAAPTPVTPTPTKTTPTQRVGSWL